MIQVGVRSRSCAVSVNASAILSCRTRGREAPEDCVEISQVISDRLCIGDHIPNQLSNSIIAPSTFVALCSSACSCMCAPASSLMRERPSPPAEQTMSTPELLSLLKILVSHRANAHRRSSHFIVHPFETFRHISHFISLKQESGRIKNSRAPQNSKIPVHLTTLLVYVRACTICSQHSVSHMGWHSVSLASCQQHLQMVCLCDHESTPNLFAREITQRVRERDNTTCSREEPARLSVLT